MEGYFKLIMAAAIIIIAVTAATMIYRIISRKIRYGVNRAKNLLESTVMSQAMELQQEEMQETPKSVSGMTKMYLPRIMKDYPQFDYDYYKQLTENMIASCLKAAKTSDTSKLESAADSLKNQLAGMTELYSGIAISTVKVHQTEIFKYEKQQNSAVITFQSAVEYMDGSLRVQTKFNIALAFVQDADKASAMGVTDSTLASVCPNCGAPLKAGEANCEYCGSLLTNINIRSWKYISFKRV